MNPIHPKHATQRAYSMTASQKEKTQTNDSRESNDMRGIEKVHTIQKVRPKLIAISKMPRILPNDLQITLIWLKSSWR